MFYEIENLDDINGGVAPILVIAGAAVVGVIANEATERLTGKDIATHVGNAISSAGDFLINHGKKWQ